MIGRSIAAEFLRAGATVILNSRSEERLIRVSEDLGNPDKLVAVHGSLLPGYAAKTVGRALSAGSLDHVVAHGAVRYWGSKSNGGFDETHSLLSSGGRRILDMDVEEFALSSSHLASLHFSAAQQLLPRIRFSDADSSYTFVTGHGGGHPGGKRSALGELNAHHVWGLSAALRGERVTGDDNVNIREVRISLDVNRPPEEREAEPRERPLSTDIGALCTGLACNVRGVGDAGDLIEVPDHKAMESLLWRYCGSNFESELTQSA